MDDADNPAASGGQSQSLPRAADMVILGGGIMGLWAAAAAEKRGIETLLIDSARIGSGASGGLLGALMPHMPDRWNGKKQFQFDALVSLEEEVARLEAATGMSCGYRRSGRIIPLPKPHLRPIAERHSQEAVTNWNGRFRWDVQDAPSVEGWPDASFCETGLVQDTLAARVSPRGLVAALKAFLRSSRHVRLAEGVDVRGLDPAACRIVLGDGGSVGFGHCIIAAGHRSFPLMQPMSPPLAKPLGVAVKGQAALLKADVDPGLPTIFLNGLYVVPHDDGHVAIGSTSEEEFADAFATDGQVDELVERAREIAPALRGAPVVERWAGLRPKAVGRDPMVGPHPDHERVVALTGGFKVSFGLAHALADAAVRAACREPMRVPGSFTFSSHVDAAR